MTCPHCQEWFSGTADPGRGAHGDDTYLAFDRDENGTPINARPIEAEPMWEDDRIVGYVVPATPHQCEGKAKEYQTLNLRPKVRVERLRQCFNWGTLEIDGKWYCWRHKDQGESA